MFVIFGLLEIFSSLFRYGPSIEPHPGAAAALKRNRSAFLICEDIQLQSVVVQPHQLTAPSLNENFYPPERPFKAFCAHFTSSGHRSGTGSTGSSIDHVDHKRSSGLKILQKGVARERNLKVTFLLSPPLVYTYHPKLIFFPP